MLFGREAERAVLQAFCARVREGRGGVALLRGAPGVGKSALAEHAAQESALRVARGAAWEAGTAPALWPWTRVFRALGRALPAAAPGADAFGQLEAIASALAEESAREPLLILLDDVHLADAGSLAALRVVADEARGRALGVIATRRDVGLTTERSELMTRLDRLGEALDLRGVDGNAAREIVRARTGRDCALDAAVELAERTAGNPFLMQEIAASGGSTRGVRDAVLAHMGQLQPREVEVLAAASVLGRAFDAELLAALAGRDPLETRAVVEHALDERLLVRDQGELRFAHALLRDTLYDALSPASRLEHHARIAEALIAASERPAEIGRHLRAAGEERREEARSWAERAVAAAAASRSLDDLADAWELRLELGALTTEAWLSAGEAARAAGRSERARACFARGLDQARQHADTELECRAVIGWSGTIEFMSRDAEHVARIEQALAHAPSPQRTVELLAQRARHAALGPADAAAPKAAAGRALALAEELADPRLLALALDARLQAAYDADNVHERLEVGGRLLAAATDAGDARRKLDAMRWQLGAKCELGLFDGMDGELDAYLQLAESVRLPGAMINARMRLAARAWQRGQFERGDAHAAEAYSIGRRSADPQAELAWFAPRMLAASLRGDAAVIHEALPVVLGGHRRLSAPFLAAVAAASLAAVGEHEQARALLGELVVDSIPRDFARLMALSALADAAADLGETRLAEPLHALLAPFAGRNVVMGAFANAGAVDHRLGRLDALLGRRESAERWLRAAVSAHEHWDAQPMLAASSSALAELVSPAEAAVLRARAERIATELGLAPLLVGLRARPRTHGAAPKRAYFARAGQRWQLGLERVSELPDRRGFAYLAALLAQPGVELEALRLAGGDATVEQAALDVSDRSALSAYRTRLEALREQHEDARARQASARADALREEIESLEDALAEGRGLGGRSRASGSNAERARSTVTVAIRRALDALDAADPALADHLRRAIRTGHRCVYTPDPNLPLDWQLGVTS